MNEEKNEDFSESLTIKFTKRQRAVLEALAVIYGLKSAAELVAFRIDPDNVAFDAGLEIDEELLQ